MGKAKRVAILGMGAMGRRHIAVVRRVEGAELAAVVDVRPEAIAAAELPGIPAYANARTMLAEVRPDIVIVATTAPSHHPLVLAAAKAGVRGIFCEKPMACSVAEAEEMIEAARAYGCALAVNHGRRRVRAYRWLAERLQSGAWGKLRAMYSGWPGIGLGCTATHLIDLWRFLGGEQLQSVFGWVDAVRGPNPRGAEFRDPGGMVVAVSSSGARYVHQQTEDGAGPGLMVIDTTGAQIVVDEQTLTMSILARDWSVPRGPGRPPKYDPVLLPPDAPFDFDVLALPAEMLRELVEERELSCTGEDGLRSLEIVAGAYVSERRGHAAVSLPIEDAEGRNTWLPMT
jgi:predicted dehydrogenase